MLCRIDRNRMLVLAGSLVATLSVAPQAWPRTGPGMGCDRAFSDSSKGTDILIAREVSKDGKNLTLRKCSTSRKSHECS